MATVVPAFPLVPVRRQREARGSIYEKYLDGRVWRVELSDHRCASVRFLQSAVMERAKFLGVLAVTRTDGDAVYVQAIRPAQEK